MQGIGHVVALKNILLFHSLQPVEVGEFSLSPGDQLYPNRDWMVAFVTKFMVLIDIHT